MKVLASSVSPAAQKSLRTKAPAAESKEQLPAALASVSRHPSLFPSTHVCVPRDTLALIPMREPQILGFQDEEPATKAQSLVQMNSRLVVD